MAEPEEIVDMEAMFDLKNAKKKKKKPKTVVAEENPDAIVTSGGVAPGDGSGANDAGSVSTVPVVSSGDEYKELLSRVFKILRDNNPELGERKRFVMKPPQIVREGTKKTVWINFEEICKLMRREPNHVFNFFLEELGTSGSVDGTNRMVMKGRYQPKHVESLLRKYIGEFVTCKMCRSGDTKLTRDPTSRLYFLECMSCGSKRSVAPIKAGFHAQIGKRKK